MNCSVPECDRRQHAKGYCYAHYFRVYRNGEPGSASIQVRNPGAACTVEGCDNPHATKGLCSKHYCRLRRYGHTGLNGVQPQPGPLNPNWVGDEVGYRGAHNRVSALRGSAKHHDCAHCGAPAKQWSYDRQDPNERQSPMGPYSADPSHYDPLCVPCHKAFDLAALAAGAAN